MIHRTEFDGLPNEIMLYGTLFSLSNRIQTIGDEVFPDITMKQHFILMTLNLLQETSPNLKEVAEIVGCSYQNIKKILVSLEKKGYIKIDRNKEDKREYKIILTKKIKKVSSDIDREINDFMTSLYKDLSKESLLSTIAVLKQMELNLKSLSKNEEYNDKPI
ncbi:MAG: MarR family transcriptional regulator [Treponema sp.]|nr:MarR family transcriptional regulator [Treponema sp.]